MPRSRFRGFPGRLGPKTVADLPLDVQRARAAYLSDTSEQLSQLFRGGVREHVDRTTDSLDAMIEAGYQFDTEGTVHKPYGDDGLPEHDDYGEESFP